MGVNVSSANFAPGVSASPTARVCDAGGRGEFSDIERFVDLQRLTLAVADNLAEVMSLVVNHALLFLPNATGAIVSLRDGDALVTRACSGTARPHVGLRLCSRTNRVWNSVATGAPFISTDTETDPLVDRDLCRSMAVRSLMVVPLCIDRVVRGVLTVVAGRPHAFDAGDLLTAELLAGPVTMGLGAEARRVQHQAHSELDRRFLATFEQAAVGIAHVDLDGRFLQVNDRFCSIAGHHRDALLAADFQQITHPGDLDMDMEYVHGLVSGEYESCAFEKRYFRCDGAIQWVRLTVSIVRASGSEKSFFVVIAEDINAQKVAQQEVLQDALTGLPNRRWLSSSLKQALLDCERDSLNAGVMFIDLDGFKHINDRFGHDVGDECLAETANCLRACAGAHATAVRLSGDEFVILSSALSENELRDLGSSAQSAIERLGNERGWPINASIGSVFVPAGTKAEPAQVMRTADGMMYTAERSGGSRHIITVMH